MAERRWWWCLIHQRVESEPDGTGADRLGPYASEALAAAAMDHVAARNDAWDNDPKWKED